jgi:alkylation response protein AidB-like acyl-CoA dehydrogenase
MTTLDLHSARNAPHASLAEVVAFVEDEVIPVASEWDRAGVYPQQLVERMKQLGLFSGARGDLVAYAAVAEEIARGWISLSPILNAHGSVVRAVEQHGTADQQQRWLPSLTAGELVGALALTEPTGGTDLQAVTSRADLVDGGWRISAHKSYITHSRHADVLMMLVRTWSADGSTDTGLGLILLESGEWEIVRELDKLGSRSVETCELRVDAVTVPADRLVGGGPGGGFRQVMDCLELGRISVAAAAVGVGQAALDSAVRRTRERPAFGQRVADFQSVTTSLGRVSIRLQAARALTRQAAADKQGGGRHDVVTSAAKVFAAETAVEAALMAMELHGGAGYTSDADVERYLRDATLYLAGEGSNTVLTDLVGRRLVRAADDAAAARG